MSVEMEGEPARGGGGMYWDVDHLYRCPLVVFTHHLVALFVFHRVSFLTHPYDAFLPPSLLFHLLSSISFHSFDQPYKSASLRIPIH